MQPAERGEMRATARFAKMKSSSPTGDLHDSPAQHRRETPPSPPRAPPAHHNRRFSIHLLPPDPSSLPGHLTSLPIQPPRPSAGSSRIRIFWPCTSPGRWVKYPAARAAAMRGGHFRQFLRDSRKRMTGPIRQCIGGFLAMIIIATQVTCACMVTADASAGMSHQSHKSCCEHRRTSRDPARRHDRDSQTCLIAAALL